MNGVLSTPAGVDARPSHLDVCESHVRDLARRLGHEVINSLPADASDCGAGRCKFNALHYAAGGAPDADELRRAIRLVLPQVEELVRNHATNAIRAFAELEVALDDLDSALAAADLDAAERTVGGTPKP